MSGPKFFQTRMGQIFYESTVPSIARSLETIASHLAADGKPPVPAHLSGQWLQLFSDEERELVLDGLGVLLENGPSTDRAVAIRNLKRKVGL